MARQKLNKNVVVGLTLFVFTLAILGSVVMVRQLQRRDPKHFVALAEQYQEEEQWQQAAVFYLKALERSEDPVHLVSYGQMMINEGEVRLAIEAWQRALILDPGLIGAHIKLLDVLVQMARLDGSPSNWRMVEEAASKLLAVGAEKNSVAEQALGHHAFGLALLHLAGPGDASESQGISELKEAARLAPEEADYPLDLADFHIRTAHVAEADRLFQELMGRYSTPGADASKVRLAYARYLAGGAKRQFDEADRSFQESVRLAEGAADAVLEAKLGYAQFLTQQWARAVRDEATREKASAMHPPIESLLKECIQADPEAFDSYVQLATLYTAAGRHAEVIDVCEQRLSRPFSRKGLAAVRKRFGFFNLMLLTSEACAARGLSTESQDDKSGKEAWFTRAEEYAERAKGEFPGHPRAIAQVGRVKVARGQDRAALQDLRAADVGYQSLGMIDWQNKILLVRQHLRLSEPGTALEVLDEVQESARKLRSGDAAFWLLYGQVLLMNNQTDRALAMCERVLLIDANDRDARQLKAAIYERTGRLADAGDLHAEVTGSGAVRAILRFREFERSGNLDQGLAVLREALQKEPADIRLVVAATGAMLNAGHDEEAAAVVSRALQAKPDEPVLRKLALYPRKDLTPQQRDEAMREIIETESDGYQKALDLAAFHFRRGETAKALEQTRAAEGHLVRQDTPLSKAATTSQHRELLLQKLRLASQLKDEAAMAEVRESAVKHNVDGAGGKMILGMVHVFLDELEPAVHLLREAVELQPTDAQALTYLGHCLNNLGRTDDAEAYFERAVRVNADEALAHRGLAAIAQARGDKEGYEEALAVCQRLTPNDPWVQAESLARKEQADPAAAIARREASLAEKPDDTDNLRRLAGLCESVKDFAKADRYYLRLLELKPEETGMVVSVAKYYRRTERPERALELLTRHAESRPTPEQKAYAQVLIAGHHINQGDISRAETTLLAAAKQAPTLEVVQSLAEFYLRSMNDPAKALPWMNQAVDLARESKSAQLPRFLAARIGCVLHRGMNDLAAARRWVDELRTTYPEDLGGLYWDAEIHARTGNVEKAVATLSEYLKKAPDDATVLFQRAKQYLSLGRTAPAIEDLERIKRTQPLALDLEPRILLGQLHARAGRVDVSVRELELLVQDAPLSARAGEELVRAYLSAKRYADAERVVAGQINRSPDAPDARWLFLRGQIAYLSGDAKKALADYQRGAELSLFSPESVWKVLDMFRQTGRFAEGVEYYERHAETTRPTIALQARHALLSARAGRKAEAVGLFRKAVKQALGDSLLAIRTVAAELHEAFERSEALALIAATPCEAEFSRANQRILIQLHRAVGRIPEAAALLQEAINTADNDLEKAGLLYEKGEMYQTVGDTSLARTAYEETLKVDDRNWAAMNNLAYLLSEKLGEHQRALSYARQAVALADTPDTLDTLGWVYVGAGNFSQAIAELSRAVRLDPTQALLLYHLGEAYRRNGQFLEAGDLLQRGLELARAAKDEALITSLNTAVEKTSRRETE